MAIDVRRGQNSRGAGFRGASMEHEFPLLVTIVLVWVYDWGFALITLATLVAYAIWTFAVTEWRTRFYRAAVEADTRANERAVDSLLNYETVKYFNNEEFEARRLAGLERTAARVRRDRRNATIAGGFTGLVAVAVTAA